MIKGCKLTLVLLSFFIFKCLGATTMLVYNQSSLNDAVTIARPGDTILLKNGEWKDTKITITTKATSAQPIIIKAQDAGQVKLTGQSNLKIGGNFIIVDGLYFTNGYAPANGVIEFRVDNNNLANNCRVTNCAITNYSKPERFNTDSWIIFWGKKNRFDHNTIGDKLNGGTTLIVNVDDERSQQNHHNIDSNYFSGRSRLGSNGGEMIRVGVSRYSPMASNTKIINNYFERCNGEVEIVSIKSGANEIAGNTFYECEGSLVLRHGDNNIVHSNNFVGNNLPNTGGVRVVNSGHKIYNNIFTGLAGDKFRSAFAIMNGVPNSALNRYMPVKNVDVYNNTFINCKQITFGAGKDAERTEAPVNTRFHDNYIASVNKIFIEDANNDGGIKFANNLYNGPSILFKGVTKTTAGIKQPSVGIDKNVTGTLWQFPQVNMMSRAKAIIVLPEQSFNLPAIINSAAIGDTIVLIGSSVYELSGPISISKPLTIMAKGIFGKPELVNAAEKSMPGFILIENGGSLSLRNIRFNSTYKTFGDVQSAVSTTTNPMNKHYSLFIDGCEFYNFNESSMSCIKGTKSTYADEVIIKNSIFRNNSGNAIDYSAEKDDKGIYNVENLFVSNCTFTNNLGSAIIIYRGGNDESTTGPSVTIDHCTFNAVDNRERGCVVKLLGVQTASILNSNFNNAGAGGRSIWFEENSWDNLKVDYCNFYKSGRIGSFYNKVSGTHIYNVEPQFTNKAVYNLKTKSPLLINKAGDGKAIGVL